MIELIFSLILIVSLGGIALLLLRKIPVLAKLAVAPAKKGEPWLGKIKKGLAVLPGFKSFSYELYLQKILSRIRVLTLKTESKTGKWLEGLRQKSNQKNNQKNDNYWEELKKAKDGK